MNNSPSDNDHPSKARGGDRVSSAQKALGANFVSPALLEMIFSINKQHAEMIRRTMQTVTPILSQIQNINAMAPKIDLPPLKLDYDSLFPNLSGLIEDLRIDIWPKYERFLGAQREQFTRMLEVVEKARQASLPPNWREVDASMPTDLEVLLLDDGLPLAWVPPADVVARVFAAPDAASRRRIIGRSWQRIAGACIDELNEVDAKQLNEYIYFARKAAESLLAGQHETSQALSANLLDTILRREFDSTDRTTITGRRNRLNIDDYPMRVAIVLGGIWGAHAEFWPSQGDRIPRSYTRHGSAHGVSHRQYSRINATLAIMHVVSLIRLMQVDLLDEAA